MKVKLLVSRSGVDFSENAGDVVDVSDQEGRRLIDQGMAEAAPAEKAETTAKESKAQTTAKK